MSSSCNKGQGLWQVTISASFKDAEFLLLQLMELFPSGVQQAGNEERITFIAYSHPSAEYALAESFKKHLQERFAPLDVCVTVDWMEQMDWVTQSQRFLQSVYLPPLRISPPWDVHGEEYELVIAPGMAFGTGGHESTRLALRAIIQTINEMPVDSLFDAGCGTAVLALAGVKLGVPHAHACDVDPVAIAVAEEVARANGLRNRIELFCADLASLPRGEEQYPLVVANITQDILLRYSDNLDALTVEGGRLVLSGIYGDQVARILEVFRETRWQRVAEFAESQWVALTLQRIAG